MTRSVYIAASERQVSKSAIALGMIDLFGRQVKSVGVFRPLVVSTDSDAVTEALLSQRGLRQSFDEAVGVTYEQFAHDPDESIDVVVAKYAALEQKCDAVVIVGSDYETLLSSVELDNNAVIAANLNSPVLYVCKTLDRSAQEVRDVAESAIAVFESKHNTVVAIAIARTPEGRMEEMRKAMAGLRDVPVYVMPHNDVLAAPLVQQQFDAVNARPLSGPIELYKKESLHTIVGAMTLPNLLAHLRPESTVVMPADRSDLLPGLLMAHKSSEFGPLAAILLTGGFTFPESIERLLSSSQVNLPLAVTDRDTFSTAAALQKVAGTSTGSARKLDMARTLFAANIDEDELTRALDLPRSEIRTPTMFEHQLMQQARSDRRRIVLPESTDDRVLEAASVVLQRGVADIILLGDKVAISRRSTELGINLSGGEVVDPTDPELVERFAEEYAKARAHKGVTVEQAREKVGDLSYFGTMMVHLGMADGMVSGAVNTTAATIRPSLEFVKTKPGVSVVSGSFLMAMSNRVVVYADCAVNPDPTPEQLADIAISTAETAAAFDIEPRVAMLSYSTGDSGSGADVEKVREATRLVRERAPHIKVEGPIQFDAAVDAVVAAKKMPGSEVAGRATVFIFPDLNTGNNTYKAVQRTSGAVAIGPVLQGLKKPVNDLSRGALVDDIVSTITITAIQAQQITKEDE